MDTEWFAVDRDGHVAMFESLLPGAVPIDAACYPSLRGRPPGQHPWVDDWCRLIEDLQEDVGKREFVVEPAAFDGSGWRQHLTESPRLQSGRVQRISGIVIFLAPGRGDPSAIPTYGAEVVVHEASTGLAVVVRDVREPPPTPVDDPGRRPGLFKYRLQCAVDWLLEPLGLKVDLWPVVIRASRAPQRGVEVSYLLDLHRQGACLGCDFAGGILGHDGIDDPEPIPNPARAGVYLYRHLGDSQGGPYGLELRPKKPVRLDDLPARFRPAIEGMRFDLSFSQTPTLTPEQHARCVSFGYDEAETRGKRGDFPAAHSMDTDWFAVDADGHVAYFHSGDDGAVPAAAPDDAFDDRRLLPRFVTEGPFACDVEGFVDPHEGRHARRGRGHNPDVTHTGPIVMFLRDRADLALPIDGADAEVLDASAGFAVNVRTHGLQDLLHRGVPLDVFRGLHERNACLGCASPGSLFQPDETMLGFHLPNPGRHGIFVYDHHEGLAGPYDRQLVPRDPLHVDFLPPALGKSVARVRLDDLCFAEAPRIQPAHHLPCRFWAPWYLTLDGSVRMEPGAEAEWLAVDGDGHVALIRSSSPSDVPHDVRPAVTGSERPRPLRDVPWNILPSDGFVIDPAGLTRAGEAPRHASRAFASGFRKLPPLLYVLGPGATLPAGRLLAASGGGQAALFDGLTSAEVSRLHEMGGCLGCYVPSSILHPGVRQNPAPAGLFVFEQLLDADLDAQPVYGRHFVPVRPVTYDELPSGVASRLDREWFADVCFADQSHV